MNQAEVVIESDGNRESEVVDDLRRRLVVHVFVFHVSLGFSLLAVRAHQLRDALMITIVTRYNKEY